MTPKYLEVRVGLFVLAAGGLLVAFALALGHVRFTHGFVLCADFAYAGGLQVGADVRVSGVNIGKVTDLELLLPGSQPPPAASLNQLGRSAASVTRACVEVDQQAQALLGAGSTLAVATQGVIGEAYLELLPQPQGAPMLTHAVVRGIDAPRLHAMALELSSILATLGGVLAEDATGKPVAQSLATLLNSLNDVVTDKRASLRQSIDEAAHAVTDLQEVMGALHHAMGSGESLRQIFADSHEVVAVMRRDLPIILSEVRAASASLRQAGDTLRPEALSQIVQGTQQATMHLQTMSQEGEALLKQLHRGEGTVGALWEDPQVYDDLRALIADLKQHPWKVLWR